MALGIFYLRNKGDESYVLIEDESGLTFQTPYQAYVDICTELSLATIPLPADTISAINVTNIPFLPTYVLDPEFVPMPPSELPQPIEDYLIYFDHLDEMIKLSYDLPDEYFPFEA